MTIAGHGEKNGDVVVADTCRLLVEAIRSTVLRLDVSADNPLGIDCRAFVMLLAAGARRKLRVALLPVSAPTVDERHIIEVVATAQSGDWQRLDLHLTTLVVPDWRDAVRAAAIDLAQALSVCAPPIRPASAGRGQVRNGVPVPCERKAWRGV